MLKLLLHLPGVNESTHWGRMMHICINNLAIIGLDNGLFTLSVPSHYLNQCWNIVNWTLRNQHQRNFHLNSNIFIHQNASESGVCEMAAILSWPQCVNIWVWSKTSPVLPCLQDHPYPLTGGMSLYFGGGTVYNFTTTTAIYMNVFRSWPTCKI